MILRELERIARDKGCRVVTLGTASYMARPFYEKHGYTVFTTIKTPNGYISYSLVKYLDRDTSEYVPTDNSGTRFKLSLGNEYHMGRRLLQSLQQSVKCIPAQHVNLIDNIYLIPAIYWCKFYCLPQITYFINPAI